VTDCVFCKIVAGELPCEKVAEGDDWIAILDIRPVAPGHTLVLSRPHVETLPEARDDLLANLIAAVRRVAPAVLRATGAEGFHLHQNNHRAAGQLVPHLHLHIIPRRSGDGIRIGWKQEPYAEGEMARTAEAVRKALTNG
jgi:histidine triad (HIT) family protein